MKHTKGEEKLRSNERRNLVVGYILCNTWNGSHIPNDSLRIVRAGGVGDQLVCIPIATS